MLPETTKGGETVIHASKRHEPIGAGVRGRARLLLGAVALWPLALCGCGLWDEFRSNDYSVKAFFVHEDPYVVLRDSTDGNKRAKALASLREPKQNGGSDKEQELVLNLLTTAASKEPELWCRLKAIESLSTFKDPRAVKALKDAYYAADAYAPAESTSVRCVILGALGQIGDPEAVGFLVTVLKEPPPEPTRNSEEAKQHAVDRRIAAARSLQHFKHYEATEALVQILRSEKDNIALRNEAHHSLQIATGKKLPADAQAWDDLLHPGSGGAKEAVAHDGEKKASILPPIVQTSGRKEEKPR